MAGYLGAGVDPTGNPISVGKPKSKKKVKKNPVAQTPAYDPLAPLTPQQIAALATQQANAALSPALQALERAGRNQSENLGAFTAAITEALGPLAGQLTDAYGGAAQVGGAFGDAFGNQLRSLGNTAGGDFLDAISAMGGQALGAEGGVQSWLQGRQPQYAVDQGFLQQQLMNRRIEDDRKGLLDQLVSLRTQARDALDKRELEKIATKASLQSLGLDEKKFLESQRQARVGEQQWAKEYAATLRRYEQEQSRWEAEQNQPDAGLSQTMGYLWGPNGPLTDANGNLIPVAVDASGSGNDKSKAQATKAKAIDDATSSIFNKLDSEFAETYNRSSGQQPVRTKTEPIMEENALEEVVQTGEKTLYWTGSGWSEDVNDALMEPAGFEEKVTVGPGEYAKVRRRVIGMLRQKLRRYVKDPKRYQQLADEILSAWYTVPERPPAKRPKGAPGPGGPAVNW